MDITETFMAETRQSWREWLAIHHAGKKEIWLVMPKSAPALTYLDSVEEALCFGWIDGIGKRMDAAHSAQRFTPRKSNSHWTELNKERARRLIAAGLMTPAGYACLPDLSLETFFIAPDILAALQVDAEAWRNFQNFPAVYQRIRIGYIEEMRRQPDIFKTRLDNFLKKTRQNKQFGGLV